MKQKASIFVQAMKPKTKNRKMKNSTTTISQVNRFLNSTDFLILNRKPRLDMRYNSSKEFMRIFYSILPTFNKQSALDKLKQRRAPKYAFTNVLSNPIYLDYANHKQDVKCVNDRFIMFYDRNHWSKNSFDTKVIQIIKKYFTAKKTGSITPCV